MHRNLLYKMEKVSVIIGLYNVSCFLKRKRLSCILNQTYPNLEIILVNDGSKDETLAICEDIKHSDSRIIIINKENGGLGSARNAGLNVATGTYIWFYDVDDEAELTLIEKNVSWMQQYKVDIIIFGYYCITPHLNTTENIIFKERLIRGNHKIRSIYQELIMVPNGNGFAWNKFYRKSFIDKYKFRFGNQRIQQDEIFNLQLYPKLESIYISSEQSYHYYIYNKGNTRSKYIKERYDIYLSVFKSFLKLSREWNLNDKRFKDYIYYRFFSNIENVIFYNTFHQDSGLILKEKRKVISTILNHEEAKNCFYYVKDNIALNLEERMYLRSFTFGIFHGADAFYSILILRTLFNLLRKVKRVLRHSVIRI